MAVLVNNNGSYVKIINLSNSEKNGYLRRMSYIENMLRSDVWTQLELGTKIFPYLKTAKFAGGPPEIYFHTKAQEHQAECHAGL